MKKILKKMSWYWKCFWGRKYFIKYTDELEEDTILVYGHRIYISSKMKEGEL